MAASLVRRICRSKLFIGLFLFSLVVISVVNFYGSPSTVAMKQWAGNFQSPVFTSSNYTVSEVKIVTSEKGSDFLIPGDDVLTKTSETDLLKIYWKYINTVQILCRNQTRVGILKDGGKEMCIDDLYKPSKPCIVYSFGSNFQFDFDVPMHNFYGCDVFTYDPSMNIKGRKLPPEIKFELRGLSHKDWINEKKWKMSTLETIMRDNNHMNSVIDILKIDVEGAEWEAVPAFLNAGIHKRVKQILIEVHAGRQGPKMTLGFWGGVNLPQQLKVLRMLYESGFRIFMREHNMYSVTNFAVPPQNQITIVNEISLLNIDFYKPT